MGQKNFTIKKPEDHEACPKCGNGTEFVARSQQVSEDCCDIWIQCKCGYDPTAESSMHRVEDVWGTLDEGTILTALDVWDELIQDQKGDKSTFISELQRIGLKQKEMPRD